MTGPASPVVGVILGSDSDLPQMQPCLDRLEELRIGFDLHVMSAHRCPADLQELAQSGQERGYGAFIAAAGGAATLAGVVAAWSTLPVVGVPIQSKALSGVDSLYSTVQMPAGIPVATMAIGEAGAANAAIFVAQIFALQDAGVARRVGEYRAGLREKVLGRHRKVHRSVRFEE